MTDAFARHCEILTPLGTAAASSRLISPIVVATSPVLNASRNADAATPTPAACGGPSCCGTVGAGPPRARFSASAIQWTRSRTRWGCGIRPPLASRNGTMSCLSSPSSERKSWNDLTSCGWAPAGTDSVANCMKISSIIPAETPSPMTSKRQGTASMNS